MRGTDPVGNNSRRSNAISGVCFADETCMIERYCALADRNEKCDCTILCTRRLQWLEGASRVEPESLAIELLRVLMRRVIIMEYRVLVDYNGAMEQVR